MGIYLIFRYVTYKPWSLKPNYNQTTICLVCSGVYTFNGNLSTSICHWKQLQAISQICIWLSKFWIKYKSTQRCYFLNLMPLQVKYNHQCLFKDRMYLFVFLKLSVCFHSIVFYVHYFHFSQLSVFVWSRITNKVCWMFSFTPEIHTDDVQETHTMYVLCNSHVNDDNTIW